MRIFPAEALCNGTRDGPSERLRTDFLVKGDGENRAEKEDLGRKDHPQ